MGWLIFKALLDCATIACLCFGVAAFVAGLIAGWDILFGPCRKDGS